MIVSAAVVPWPPALVPELMGRAASELEPLRHAADRALSGLLAARDAASAGAADSSSAAGDGGPAATPRVVVVAPGEPAEHAAAGELSFADFGRDVRVPALPGAGGPVSADLPTPVMVARYLASRVSTCDAGVARTWAAARWLTVDEAGAPALAETLRDDPEPIALLLLVDGAASHGPKAPRAEDSRAGAFDESVADALAAGDAGRLAAVDLDLARELGAEGAYLWPFLATATATATATAAASATATAAATTAADRWQGDVLWRGEPYGVGWTVALWRRG